MTNPEIQIEQPKAPEQEDLQAKLEELFAELLENYAFNGNDQFAVAAVAGTLGVKTQGREGKQSARSAREIADEINGVALRRNQKTLRENGSDITLAMDLTTTEIGPLMEAVERAVTRHEPAPEAAGAAKTEGEADKQMEEATEGEVGARGQEGLAPGEQRETTEMAKKEEETGKVTAEEEREETAQGKEEVKNETGVAGEITKSEQEEKEAPGKEETTNNAEAAPEVVEPEQAGDDEGKAEEEAAGADKEATSPEININYAPVETSRENYDQTVLEELEASREKLEKEGMEGAGLAKMAAQERKTMEITTKAYEQQAALDNNIS